jgi:hypothetical protein
VEDLAWEVSELEADSIAEILIKRLAEAGVKVEG